MKMKPTNDFLIDGLIKFVVFNPVKITILLFTLLFIPLVMKMPYTPGIETTTIVIISTLLSLGISIVLLIIGSFFYEYVKFLNNLYGKGYDKFGKGYDKFGESSYYYGEYSYYQSKYLIKNENKN